MATQLKLELDSDIFNADTTLASGQTFRIRKGEDGIWRGIIGGNAVEVQQRDTKTIWSWTGSARREDWEHYLDLGCDYTALFEDPDEVFQEALRYAKGLRILRQDPFETLISFIVSSNNNIGRIGRILDAIARACGTKIEGGYAFPTPQQLSELREADFRDLGAGYRAKYLEQSAKRALDTDFSVLAELDYKDLLAALTAFAGVGPKVADCIALFAFGKTEAFPVDVWIERIMRQLYGMQGTRSQIREQATSKFGKNAGIAQQYLFHYARGTLQSGT